MFGALCPGPQIGSQLVTVAGGISAEAGQHFLRIGADPARLGPGGFGGGLRAAGFLLREPGSLFCLRGQAAGLVPVGAGGADTPRGLGAYLGDSSVALGFGSGNPRGCVPAGRLDSGVPVGLGGAAGCLSLNGAGLGGVQLANGEAESISELVSSRSSSSWSGCMR